MAQLPYSDWTALHWYVSSSISHVWCVHFTSDECLGILNHLLLIHKKNNANN